jgi:hypothetical protein
MVDQLTLEEKERRFGIAHPRCIRERGDELAEEVAEARRGYQEGRVEGGSVEEPPLELEG